MEATIRSKKSLPHNGGKAAVSLVLSSATGRMATPRIPNQR